MTRCAVTRRTLTRRLTTLAVVASPLLVLAPTAQADQVQCEPGKTRYVDQQSYNLSSLGVPQSWALSRGAGVTVAVVDSGVDTRNAHLPDSAVLPGKSFVPGEPSARQDDQGHGTAVAGIIAARYVAGSALVGAAPEATILPVRIYKDLQSDANPNPVFPPTTDLVAQGIRWAATHGADVINVSLSASAQDTDLPALRAAVRTAYRRGAVVVASGGDNPPPAQTPLTQVRYPAALPHVLGVAAADQSGQVDNFSTHGPQIDVAAPGASVLFPFSAYGDCVSDQTTPYTSYSAPFVSALAAQLRSRFPDESADLIDYRIIASADRPRLDQRNDVDGWGLIQPYEALAMSIDPQRPGPPVPGTSQTGQQVRAAPPLRPVTAQPDPREPARQAALWWGLLAVGLSGGALVLRPWLLRLVRRA